MNRKLVDEIKSIRSKLGNSVVIPAHHYEFPDVVALSDFVGDSYKLAVECSRLDSDFIVFCGVKFMAEGASLLCKKHQKVLIPEMSAGCSMAKMIDIVAARMVYEKIRNEFNEQVVPVVYVNSYADVKSFCGEKSGATCTSSNAAKIITYFLEKDKTVFFSPDFNLGKNTAFKLGIKEEEIIKVYRDLSFDRSCNPKKAKIFIWDGFCYVHKNFKVSDIEKLKNLYRNINIIVHPECDEAVRLHTENL
ncbi:MAG: quinolinate synthase NadA [Candidatus Cloacimonetes bacterium]|nr:quinolinate synthase NadA [Candidatus Cloacimonadota bacterium]